MAPRKPTCDWKARNCAELENFTVAYAAKEYIQNVAGQALKDLRVREWSDWKREDYRPWLCREFLEHRKQRLINDFPGLLSGPDGALLKRTKNWLPAYIVSAIIPNAQIKLAARRAGMEPATETDLKIALVLWRHAEVEIQAFTAFNNHLDPEAGFWNFVVDGASTSRDNPFAVGEKGKGFGLGTQYFFEYVLEYPFVFVTGSGSPNGSRSRAGAAGKRCSRLSSRTSRLIPPKNISKTKVRVSLKLIAAPHSKQSKMTARSSLRLKKLKKCVQRRKKRWPRYSPGESRRVLVDDDEVSIIIIGLEGALTPEYLFSNIYGIIHPEHAWRVPGSLFQFFLAGPGEADEGEHPTARFYHRDQYVPHSSIHLNKLSINYHGDLSITADRVAIKRNHRWRTYQRELAKSADDGFRTIPDLAVQLALDILSDEDTEALSHLLNPRDASAGNAYRTAFEAAMRIMHPEIAADAPIYPTATGDGDFCRELSLTPVDVSFAARSIMKTSGVYLSLRDHACQLLLSAPPLPNTHGLARLRTAITILAPDAPSDNVTIRDYNKSSPTVVWDKPTKVFAFALPPRCAVHKEGNCLCWIGPVLHDAARDYDGQKLETNKLFRGYLLCMKGDANMEDNQNLPPDVDVDMEDDGACLNLLFFKSLSESLSR
ncbi:hypothetical protein DFH09DRAFT_1029158 [Mycena vulgaris]|nr:hypothetical protein DFH09DRAFT_1029158 [Mycena vulgaris]